MQRLRSLTVLVVAAAINGCGADSNTFTSVVVNPPIATATGTITPYRPKPTNTSTSTLTATETPTPTFTDTPTEVPPPMVTMTPNPNPEGCWQLFGGPSGAYQCVGPDYNAGKDIPGASFNLGELCNQAIGVCVPIDTP